MVVFNKFLKIIHDVFKTLYTFNMILLNKIHNIQRIILLHFYQHVEFVNLSRFFQNLVSYLYLWHMSRES
jgi:hypothetical protein